MQFAYVRKYMDSTEVHWFMHRSIKFVLSDYTLETMINLHFPTDWAMSALLSIP